MTGKAGRVRGGRQMVEGMERRLRQAFIQAEAAAEEEIRRVKEEAPEQIREAEQRTEEERAC
jgi:vacuolar-type H+-ATPase subunit H